MENNEKRPNLMRQLGKALVYLGAFLLIQVVVGTIWNLVDAKTEVLKEMEASTKMVAVSGLASIVALIVFLALRWTRVSRHYLKTHPWGVFFWCAIATLGCIIPSEWMMEHLEWLPNVVEDEMNTMLGSKWGIIAIGVLAPVVEEAVFRGAILRTLLKWQGTDGVEADKQYVEGGNGRHWCAIALSALIFSFSHLNPAQMPYAFLVGLLLGWVYYRTHSILPGIVIHWVNNSVACILFKFYPDPDMKLIDLYGGNNIEVALSIAFSLIILIPALLQLNARMKRE